MFRENRKYKYIFVKDTTRNWVLKFYFHKIKIYIQMQMDADASV